MFVPTIVAQASNYLVAPTAVMHAGLQDVGSLHKRLGELRRKADLQADDGRGEFFVRGYGGDYKYRSNLSTLKYGQNADVDYAALQAGGNIYGFERDKSITRMGLAASYGSLSFTPERVGSQKTQLDNWSVMPYVSWQHDSGAYVDVVASYGSFKGKVTTAARGVTAQLKGSRLTGSVEVGMPFALLRKQGLTIEPQAQVTYSQVKFDKTRDVDGFAVELGTVEQVTVRAGLRLLSVSPLVQAVTSRFMVR